MRFRLKHLLVAVTAVAVALVVFEPGLPSFLADLLPPSTTTRVVVAGVDLEDGTWIKAEQLVLKDWPEQSVPDGAFTDIEHVAGRKSTVSLPKGQPILDGQLQDGPYCCRFGKKGMRAFTILAPSFAPALQDAPSPKDRVRVWLTWSRSDATASETIKFLEDIEILLVDCFVVPGRSRENGKGKVGIRSVTLQVTPDDFARLSYAQHMGKLTLSLSPP